MITLEVLSSKCQGLGGFSSQPCRPDRQEAHKASPLHEVDQHLQNVSQLCASS